MSTSQSKVSRAVQTRVRLKKYLLRLPLFVFLRREVRLSIVVLRISVGFALLTKGFRGFALVYVLVVGVHLS